MNIDLNSQNFPGTKITTPAEKFHAMAIIQATNDKSGLDKINFNLTALMKRTSHEDICFVLGKWATEPINRSPGKYIRFPAAGKEALINRAESIIKFIGMRQDIDNAFISLTRTTIHDAINEKITYLGHNEALTNQ